MICVLLIVAGLVVGAVVLVRRFFLASDESRVAQRRRSSDAALTQLATLSNVRLSRSESFVVEQSPAPVDTAGFAPAATGEQQQQQQPVRKRVTPRNSVEEV